jgi:hypothetical protein
MTGDSEGATVDVLVAIGGGRIGIRVKLFSNINI